MAAYLGCVYWRIDHFIACHSIGCNGLFLLLFGARVICIFNVQKTRMQIQKTDGIGCELCEEDFKKYESAHSDAKNVKINLNVNNSSNPSTKRPIKVSRINQNYYIFSNGLMDHQLPTSRLRIFDQSCQHQIIFRNSFDAFYKIARYEGIPHLYTGLGVTLWMVLLFYIEQRDSSVQTVSYLGCPCDCALLQHL